MCGYPIQNFMKMILERSKGKNNKNPCRDQCQLYQVGGGIRGVLAHINMVYPMYMCPPFGMPKNVKIFTKYRKKPKRYFARKSNLL